jgi:hypothetical protein
MRTIAFLPVLAFAALLSATDVSSASKPVVVELFTSEGCSSCPPADALLMRFDQAQPIAGAQIIVLSEHVDYWNHIGWKDPYSSKFFSDRQSGYSANFGLATVYTPQMVVGGAAQFTGSDSETAKLEIEKARSRQNVEVSIVEATFQSGEVRARIHAHRLTENGKSADVIVALALSHAESQVLRGENSGRHLSHAGVVQQLVKAGAVDGARGFDAEVRLKAPAPADSANLRVIAFVQQSGQKQILGAAMQKIEAGK